MGKVCEVDGFKVVVRTNEYHPLPHVHVIKAGTDASFFLGDETTEPSEGPNDNMKRQDWKRAFELVRKYKEQGLAEWRRMYGPQEDA